jgi:hypothetical protein
LGICVFLLGGIPTPLKNMNQSGLFFPMYGKVNAVPYNQPAENEEHPQNGEVFHG